MKAPPLHKRIRNHLSYLLVLIFIRLIRLMPRDAVFALMNFMGRLAFRFGGSARRRTLEQLKQSLGNGQSPLEIKQIASQVFCHFATAAAELLRLPQLISQDLNRLVEVRGIEHLETTARAEKGRIMVTCHFGNWEVMGAWLAANGHPINALATPLFDPRFDRILNDLRRLAGNKSIARGRATRELVRALQRGESIGLLIDQDTKTDGVFVDFFGRPTYTPVGPAVLARKFKVPIIPIFMYIKEDRTYVLECQPPIEQPHSSNPEDDVLEITQRISAAYEEMIRRHPEQWAWMHKRWKTQPKNHDSTTEVGID